MDSSTLHLLWYWVSSLLLSAALYLPVSRLIWVWRVRSLERRLGRKGNDTERLAERRRARLLGDAAAITFAFLFNRVLLGSS